MPVFQEEDVTDVKSSANCVLLGRPTSVETSLSFTAVLFRQLDVVGTALSFTAVLLGSPTQSGLP